MLSKSFKFIKMLQNTGISQLLFMDLYTVLLFHFNFIQDVKLQEWRII